MGKVSHGNLLLLLNVGEERSAVVDTEVEDTVLIGGLKGHTEDGGVLGLGQRGEIQAMEGRKHRKFELNCIRGSGGEWDKVGL